MRISISKACLSLAFLCMIPTTGFAEEKSYVCAINEVYECVTVTGCSRVSLADANVAGIMVLDMEKKQLRSAPLGGEPRVDDIEGLSVTDKAILIHGTGKRETDRTVSALISLETGNLTAGISTLRFVDFPVGELLSPTLVRGGHWLLRQPLLAAGVPSISAFPPRLDDESKIKKKALRRISVRVG